ncbi:NADH-quinone oxidoreductase subunit NuoH [Propioniciclava tarda]|uniref:NADH-quinone oxidoreductase subunit NuoH n=1 Tax=Propioniciclava tarda TaxID=433330 RepID=UPI00116AE6EE|nr:NADH-quinone oxidoreductase subunit NuoH [Propioniciclava tarda]SMO72490.1 NADH-quinone oxidoreductase subunit H [Propioniciclava tarda]HOA88098.1 NADH-quinone oxidoreductase subunit NuoH [Propioniciclava tarda]HQA30989.1 NADH-quinone oxidoreductase subunit NuoH [Propioniciclava tarda]HQD59965.1 NADH-quinone oxidoreductase subunit NuoH [Propioniciclava tarda]
MIALDTKIFFNDPWWIVAIKCIGVVVLLLTWTIVNVWYERRLVGKMQHRLGPIMNGPFGLGQALADGMKLLVKEDFAPGMVDRVLYTIAPLIVGVCAFTAWSVIPLGGEVNMFGVMTRLQVTDLPVGTLVILAMSSVAVYGFVLAGWSSNSPYSLLGALRSSAQMISYEISMGLSFVAVFLYAGTMATSDIVDLQAQPFLGFAGFQGIGIQNWYWLVLFPSFVVYVISMVGETNRAPFDLPECESELVSGHLTEYSGFRYAVFFLAEYINMATVSAVCATLFLGGYHSPILPGVLDAGYLGIIWFILKVQLLISFFVWLRGTLPRLRYDQFMDLGWKVMIPFSLVWLMAIATVKGLRNANLLTLPVLLIGFAVLALAALAWMYLGGKPEPVAEPLPEVFDAFAGGYPVPPMPGQTLPELADVVAGSSEPDLEPELIEDAVGAASGREN